MRKRWKGSLIGGALALAVVVPTVVMAGLTGSFIDFQLFQSRNQEANTASTQWQNVPGLGNVMLCTGQTILSSSVNGTFTGAPVQLRVRVEGQNAHGSPAHFDPRGRHRSFSYTFDSALGADTHDVDVQWRSPTGEVVTLHNANVNFIYRQCV